MYLFLLTRKAGYDEARSFVICAESEAAARRIAHENGGDETQTREWELAETSEWLDSATCQIIGEPLGVTRGVILRDYRGG